MSILHVNALLMTKQSYTKRYVCMSLLETIVVCPLLGAIGLLFLPSGSTATGSTGRLAYSIAFAVSCWTLVLSLFLWVQFDSGTADFQFCVERAWIPSANLSCALGIDGISLFFVLLTTLLTPICLLTGWTSVQVYPKEYCIAFLVLESSVILIFTALDLMFFYVFFETVLIPMFAVVGIWGSRERKVRAAYQFFLYTFLGSVLMLLALLALYIDAGSLDYRILREFALSPEKQWFLWLAFFASFAVKVPLIPVHLWLPEAHVEAPTAGSVLLAGVLLKLGSYGLLRFSMVLFPHASLVFAPAVFLLSLLGVVYASLTTLRQVDLKKIIAYSSVAHMGVVTLGLFSWTLQGVEGSLLLQLSHGAVSAGLFLCIGSLYDRTKTRVLPYYSGLVQTMPVFATIFLILTLANIGVPGTSSFPAEMLAFFGTFKVNPLAGILAATGMVTGAAYSLWLYNRLIFGTIKTHAFQSFADFSRREVWMLLPLVILALWMGITPDVFLTPMHPATMLVLEYGFACA